MNRTKLLVSVSTGRSSNFMAQWLKENLSEQYEMLFVCANTSREHEDSLRFQRACDRHFGLNLVYVQAVVHPGERKGSTFEVVGENSLATDGSVFESVIAKYGLANSSWGHCTRELKINPIHAYAESVWGPDYLTAIGIRADEPDRLRKAPKRRESSTPWRTFGGPRSRKYWSGLVNSRGTYRSKNTKATAFIATKRQTLN